MPKKSFSFSSLLNNLRISLIRTFFHLSRQFQERTTVARKILQNMGKSADSPDISVKHEELLSRELEKLEDEGYISVTGGLIHPSPERENELEVIEKKVVRAVRQIDDIELPEKTEVYLELLRKSKELFSWRHTFFYRYFTYVKNLLFFWRTHFFAQYRGASKLAEKFFEWETTIHLKDGPEEIRSMLERHFDHVNEYHSSTILERTSFGMADKSPLGREPVFIISDLHLSSGTKFDRFNKAAKLVRLLKVVENLNATLIINGDFFDFWQAGPRKIFSQYKEILWELIRIKRVILISGNHDDWLENFDNQRFLMPNISVMREYFDPDNRLYIEHGHRGDPVNSSFLGEIFAKTITACEKLSGLHLAEKAESFLKMVLPQSFWFQHQIQCYVTRIENIISELGWESDTNHLVENRVIFGHIHYKDYLKTISIIQQECRKKFNTLSFISSGHWTDINPILLFMDGGKIFTISLKGGTDDFISVLKRKTFDNT